MFNCFAIGWEDPIVSGPQLVKGQKKGQKNLMIVILFCDYGWVYAHWNIPHTGLETLTHNWPVMDSSPTRGTAVSNSRIRKKDHFPRNYEEYPVWDLLIKNFGVVSNSRIREFVKFTRGVYSEGSPQWGWNTHRLGCGFESHPGYKVIIFTNS